MLDKYLVERIKRNLEDLGVYGTSIRVELAETETGDWLTITLSNRGVVQEYNYPIQTVLFSSRKIDVTEMVNKFIESLRDVALQQFFDK